MWFYPDGIHEHECMCAHCVAFLLGDIDRIRPGSIDDQIYLWHTVSPSMLEMLRGDENTDRLCRFNDVIKKLEADKVGRLGDWPVPFVATPLLNEGVRSGCSIFSSHPKSLTVEICRLARRARDGVKQKAPRDSDGCRCPSPANS